MTDTREQSDTERCYKTVNKRFLLQIEKGDMATPAAKRQRKEMNGNGSGFGFDVGVNYREGEVSVWTLSCCYSIMGKGSSEQNFQENIQGLRECLHNCHGMSICILC